MKFMPVENNTFCLTFFLFFFFEQLPSVFPSDLPVTSAKYNIINLSIYQKQNKRCSSPLDFAARSNAAARAELKVSLYSGTGV